MVGTDQNRLQGLIQTNHPKRFREQAVVGSFVTIQITPKTEYPYDPQGEGDPHNFGF